MPSAVILFAFALSTAAFAGPIASGFLHGLKLVAVAVVAQAVWGMARSLTPDRARAGIALVAVAIVSGCLIVAYLGETIVAIGLWLLHMAVVLAIGFAIGSICYTVASKLSDMLMEKVHVRNVANVLGLMGPSGALEPDWDDEIVAGMCVLRDGAAVAPAAVELLGGTQGATS